jgi:hypothetical protein
MRETALRFFARARHLPAAAGAQPFTEAFRRRLSGRRARAAAVSAIVCD